MASQRALGCFGITGVEIAKNMRMAADQLFGDAIDDVADIEMAGLAGHLGVIDRLQQQIAEFLAQIGEILALDSVGDLVGFLDGVVADGRKILLQIPGATADQDCAGRP